MASEHWDIKELKDLLTEKGYIRGPFGSALRRPELQSEGIPVYEQQNAIYDHRIFRFFIDKEKYEKLKRFTVRENDLIISCSGTFGKVSIIKKGDPIGIISQALLILRPDTHKVYPDFLKYFFTSKQGYNAIASRSIGSVQVNIAKREIIEKIEIEVPPLSEQQYIAKILSNLDDKIKINQQMNKTLEDIGQTFFKHWFIDFEFPNENGEPYKSNGGEMVYSEELNKEIPMGWEIGKLKDVTSLIRDGTHNPPQRIKQGIPLITGNNVISGFVRHNNITYISQEDYIKIHKRYTPERGDVLITKIGTLGKVGIIREIDLPIAIHCNVALVRPNYQIMTGIYLYWLFKSNYFLSQFHLKKKQTVQEFINLKQIGDLDILIPPKKVILSFEKMVQNSFDKMSILNVQSNTLSQIRDILLPKLMSGKIRVKISTENGEQ